jgi:hypothetical protein
MPSSQRPPATGRATAKPTAADGRVRVPDDVIHRAFGDQLVILNLRTGQYHGLNPTARRMFELLLERAETAGVPAQLAIEYGRPEAELAADLGALCRALTERGLLEIDSPSAS